MGPDQIIGVYGNWFIRGSDLDLDNPDEGSIFPEADPSPEEVSLLSQAVNLSPTCFDNRRGCFELDADRLVDLNPDYFVYIDNGVLAEELEAMDNPTNIEIIFIDTLYKRTDGCRDGSYQVNPSNCISRSSIDIAQRIEELAVALGATVPASVEQDKKEMCQAAETFTQTMEQAHNRGVRALATVLLPGDTMTLRMFDPVPYWNLRTFEELGMPLLHADNDSVSASNTVTADDFFPACPQGSLSQSCNRPAKLPVDFWIFDSRSFSLVSTDAFTTSFPDQAVIQGQFWHWARSDGAISYKSIANILNRMSQELGRAQRIHDRTPCVGIDVTSALHTNASTGGLSGGQYACYNRNHIEQAYLSCAADSPASDAGRSSVSSPLMLAGLLIVTRLLTVNRVTCLF